MPNPFRISMICVLSAVCCLLPLTAFADVPPLIRYQGQAVDSKGVPLEGPYTLTFRLYDAETGGTKVWEEIQANVQLTGGQFSVLLGQVTPLSAMDWSKACWLSVQVNSEPELAPRQRITSVPLAIRAGTAETAATATLAQKAEQLTAPVTTSTITDDANGLVPSGAILLVSSASCPTGYTRLTALDGKFLVGGATFNAAAGGSNTKDLSHTHGAGSYAGPSHTHTGTTGKAASQNGSGQVDNQWNPPTHTHPFTTDPGGTGAVTGTSATGGAAAQDIRPAFATVLLCKKD